MSKNLKRGRKIQSAMEYLVTYGWAILVIAVVLGILFYFGVFSPHSVSNSCIPESGYYCQRQTLSSNGSLSIQFSQVASNPITVTGISCTNNQTAMPQITTLANSITLQSGDIQNLTFQCGSGGPIGTTFNGYLWLQYNAGSQTGLISRFAVISTEVARLGASTTIAPQSTSINGPTFNLALGRFNFFHVCSPLPTPSPPVGEYAEAQNVPVVVDANPGSNCNIYVIGDMGTSVNALTFGILRSLSFLCAPGSCTNSESIPMNHDYTVLIAYEPKVLPITFSAIGDSACIAAAEPNIPFGAFSQNVLRALPAFYAGTPNGCVVSAWNITEDRGIANATCNGLICSETYGNPVVNPYTYCSPDCPYFPNTIQPFNTSTYSMIVTGVQVAFNAIGPISAPTTTGVVDYIGYAYPGCAPAITSSTPAFGAEGPYEIGNVITLSVTPPAGCAVAGWGILSGMNANAFGPTVSNLNSFEFTDTCKANFASGWCPNSKNITVTGNMMVEVTYEPVSTTFSWNGNACSGVAPSPSFGSYSENTLQELQFYSGSGSGDGTTFYANPGSNCEVYSVTQQEPDTANGVVSCTGYSCQIVMSTVGQNICGTPPCSTNANLVLPFNNSIFVNYGPLPVAFDQSSFAPFSSSVNLGTSVSSELVFVGAIAHNNPPTGCNTANIDPSVTVDGNAATKITSAGESSGCISSLWYYMAPSSGSHTANVNENGAAVYANFGASFENADTSGITSNSIFVPGSVNPSAVSVNVNVATPGSLIFATGVAGCSMSSSTWTGSPDVPVGFDGGSMGAGCASGNDNVGAAYLIATSTGTYTITFNSGGVSSAGGVSVSVAVIPPAT